jgi:hypothetical protein
LQMPARIACRHFLYTLIRMNKRISSVIGIVVFCAVLFTYAFSMKNTELQSFLQRDKTFVPQEYFTEASGPDECYEDERWDAAETSCVYVCSTEAECQSFEEQASNELDQWAQEKDGFASAADDRTDVPQSKNVGEVFDVEYAVKPAESLELVAGTDSENARILWARVAGLSPDTLSTQYINEFKIYTNTKDDTIAYVVDENGDGKWTVAINRGMYDTISLKEQSSTVIHELAHIITLNSSQVKAQDESACTTQYMSEGCAGANSYLYTFIQAFWPSEMLEKIGGIDSDSGAEKVYTDKKFVTEYAATNPAEDIAESFAVFVLESKPEGTEERDTKTTFFYSFPALVEMRTAMRTELVGAVIRAKRPKQNI